MHCLDIAVVGTGTAGSAAALFLSRAGHRVTLYERVLDPAPVGAGIMLQPSGMAVLTQLGLVEHVVARGERIDHLWCQTPDGTPVLSLSYAELADDLYGVGLHRGVLFKALFDAVKREPRIDLRLGVDIEDLARAPKGHWLIERASRQRHGPHELVVVANGARSSLRDDTAFVKTAEPYPWGALWAVVPDPQHRFHTRLFQVVNGTQRLTGLLPTGLGPSGDVPLVSLFFSLPARERATFAASDFDEWRERVIAEVPASEPVLRALNGPGELLFSEYHDVSMWPWNTHDVVYVGDSAHAMSPQLGQGANLALVDAAVLSRCVERHTVLADALYAYSRERRRHLAWYQFITRALTPFFQSDAVALGPLRDVGLPLATKLAFARRAMVAGMAGSALGPFGAGLPLAHRPPSLPRR